MGESSQLRAARLAAELRALTGRLKRRLREQASVGDLPPSQISVLLRLEKDGPATLSGLARAEGMRPQSMGAIIAPLEEAGMVVGAPHATDGRQVMLSLTESCRNWIQQGRAARQDWLSGRIQSRLSADEQEILAHAIEFLKRLIED